MFRHLAIAALRNLNANRLQSAIAIIGLAIGIATALLMALVVRNQLTYDHFIPGYERTYQALIRSAVPGRPVFYDENTPSVFAGLLKLNAPEVENTTRVALPPQNTMNETFVTLKNGEFSASEVIYWADPNVFDVLPMPLFKGDLAKALSRPDGIVLPRETARKYFGRDDVVGQTIQVNNHPMTVRAVIEDLPANGTSLKSGIFASSLSSYSPFQVPSTFAVMTYVRLKPGASPASFEKRLPDLINKFAGRNVSNTLTMMSMALDQLPLFEEFHPGVKTRLTVLGMAGILILAIAAINFVNLLTARAARRALEVGMRKVCGASRRLLVLQFLGESVLTVLFATCIALALCEGLLPPANAFLGTGMQLDFWQNPLALALLLFGVLALGLLAGAYPAFVLSSFRPAGVLKGVLPHSTAADLVRKGLVVLQFAILIGLVVSAAVIYQQNLYATRDGLRGNIDQIVVTRGGCKPAFRAEVRKLPGVSGVSCAAVSFLDPGIFLSEVTYKGQQIYVDRATADKGTFALYGIKPLFGSLPPANESGDFDPIAQLVFILNEAAVKRFGFASPQAAIGQTIPQRLALPLPGMPASSGKIVDVPIVAVVPDFSFKALADEKILPTIYSANQLQAKAFVNIKLKGQQLPETLAAIDRVWSEVNPGIPIHRYFFNEHMQQLYLSMLRQAQLFAIFSGVAIFLACLGLLGLTISAAERRTKEIGVRKAMGAGSGDITRLLLWQFTSPVLWANLIAWPAAFYLMTNWLNNFAYHIVLEWWFFAGATLLAIFVSLLTVTFQAIRIARAVPATALRYE